MCFLCAPEQLLTPYKGDALARVFVSQRVVSVGTPRTSNTTLIHSVPVLTEDGTLKTSGFMTTFDEIRKEKPYDFTWLVFYIVVSVLVSSIYFCNLNLRIF